MGCRVLCMAHGVCFDGIEGLFDGIEGCKGCLMRSSLLVMTYRVLLDVGII